MKDKILKWLLENEYVVNNSDNDIYELCDEDDNIVSYHVKAKLNDTLFILGFDIIKDSDHFAVWKAEAENDEEPFWLFLFELDEEFNITSYN